MAFKFIPVASGMHKHEELMALQGAYEQALGGIGGQRMDGAAADGEDAAFIWVMTGGVEQGVIRRHRSRIQQGKTAPLLLIAHSAHSALAASLEILAQVRQENGTGRIYLLRNPHDRETLEAIQRTAWCMAANRRLAADRLGLIGPSSDWLVASSHRPELVTGRFGMRVIPLEVEAVREELTKLGPVEDGEEFRILEQATGTDGVNREAFAKAVGVYRAMKALVSRNRLDAFTIRCFDLVIQDGVSGCLALSLLADQGISSGCEGDIPSIIMLRWLWHLTGQTGWMANPSDLDVTTGDLLLAHCTVPLGMTESYGLKTHFESGLGVGLDGTLRKGPVTLLRLGGCKLDRWWGAEGELTGTSHAPDLCRTQATIRIPPASASEWLADPLGNHLILVPGHVKDLFREAFELNRAMTLPGTAIG